MPSPIALRRSVAVLAVLVPSTAVAVLALVTARGVTHLGGDSYATEFITASWWAAFALVPLPALTARRSPRTAWVQTLALVVPHVAAATVCVARYRASGWSDGLEGLAYLHPMLLAVVTAALVGSRRPG